MAASLSLDAALGGGAWLFHATSLLWHAAAAVLVVVAAEALGLTRRAGVVAGMLLRCTRRRRWSRARSRSGRRR